MNKLAEKGRESRAQGAWRAAPALCNGRNAVMSHLESGFPCQQQKSNLVAIGRVLIGYPDYLWMSGSELGVLVDDSFTGLLPDQRNAPTAEKSWR